MPSSAKTQPKGHDYRRFPVDTVARPAPARSSQSVSAARPGVDSAYLRQPPRSAASGPFCVNPAYLRKIARRAPAASPRVNPAYLRAGPCRGGWSKAAYFASGGFASLPSSERLAAGRAASVEGGSSPFANTSTVAEVPNSPPLAPKR